MIDDEFLDVNGEPHGTSRDEIIEGLANFRLDLDQYDDFPKEMWKDEEVIMQSIIAGNHMSELLPYIHDSLWRNRKFVMNLLTYAERYCQSDDIEGINVKNYIHPSLKDCIQIRPLLDSYLDNLSED